MTYTGEITEMDPIILKAMDEVFDELMAMPREVFLRALKEEGNGDIKAILLYTGALQIRQTEADEFAFVSPNVTVTSGKTYRLISEMMINITPNPVLNAFASNKEYLSNRLGSMSLLSTSETMIYSTKLEDELEWAA